MQIIEQCLNAAVHDPFFPDVEFHTIFGLEREDVTRVARQWRQYVSYDREAKRAVSNAILDFLSYPHGCGERLAEYVTASWDELDSILKRWRVTQGLEE